MPVSNMQLNDGPQLFVVLAFDEKRAAEMARRSGHHRDAVLILSNLDPVASAV